MKNELEQKNNLVAIGALAIFYFVFLGGEYLFDNMIAHYLSSAKVVVAQSGILGISGIGFLCYFQIQRFISSKNRSGALMGAVALGIVCIFMVQQHVSFAGTLSTGLILFVRRVLCRLFHDGIPGSFHEDEEACTVGRYGAGDQ